ncbi:MAG: hypothetical protein AAB295_06390 [Chloroflexota bacterium]
MPIRPDQFVLGIDPDTHHAGLALVSAPRVERLAVGAIDRGARGFAAAAGVADAVAEELLRWVDELRPHVARIVIESQRIYPGARSKARPEDILRLGWAAGGILVAARLAFPNVPPEEVWIVEPRTWCGTVGKSISQRRIRARLLWTPGCDALMRAQHKSHVTDAAGLAAWGCDDANGLRGGVERLPAQT